MAQPVVFLASIAPIESAIRFTGDGNGQRVTLDIPELQIGNAAGLLAVRRRLLRITVEDCGPISNYNLAALVDPVDVALEAPGEAGADAPETATKLRF